MANETDAPKVVAVIDIPPPVSAEPKRDWREPPPNLPFGHRLLNEIDPERTMLYPDQQRKVLAIENEEALKAMLYADLGDTLNPDIMTAQKVFGDLVKREFEIPSILMTWQFYTLAQCMLAIDDGRKLAADKTLSGAERVKGFQIQMEGVRALIQINGRLSKLASKMGAIKYQSKKKKVAKVARAIRAAPTLSPEPQA